MLSTVSATGYPLRTHDSIERGRTTMVIASTTSTIEAIIPYFILAGVIGFHRDTAHFVLLGGAQ